MYAKRKELDPNAKMPWLTPFGSVDERMSSQVLLQGTLSFPSVTFEDHQHTLPKQSDDHCCGVAAIAVVAILLRDLFDQGEDKEKFETIFSISNTEVQLEHEENMVTIKKGYLKHLPKVRRNSDYLWVLKGQFYQFFDRLATLEHKTSVERYNALARQSERKIPWEVFEKVKQTFEWPPLK
jgi:hypothetical protein